MNDEIASTIAICPINVSICSWGLVVNCVSKQQTRERTSAMMAPANAEFDPAVDITLGARSKSVRATSFSVLRKGVRITSRVTIAQELG